MEHKLTERLLEELLKNKTPEASVAVDVIRKLLAEVKIYANELYEIEKIIGKEGFGSVAPKVKTVIESLQSEVADLKFTKQVLEAKIQQDIDYHNNTINWQETVVCLQSENAALKAKLEKALIPKVPLGQNGYFCDTDDNSIIECRVLEVTFGNPQGVLFEVEHLDFLVAEDELYPSKEAALASLKPEGESV